MSRHHVHEMPFGAALLQHGTAFRLYAPSAKIVAVVCDLAGAEHRFAMKKNAEGFFETVVADAAAGTRYRFDIDGVLAPDPASRFAPDGVHGKSVVIDPCAYDWPDSAWRGLAWHEHIFYELHVGTFTPEGTYAAAMAKLPELKELGITAVELLPVAQPAGNRNWGYDGVLLYAPAHIYGTPEDLKTFIVAAHELGLAVFLDVVYNHFGPEGNYLHGFAPEFYTEEKHTPWGAAIDVEPDHRESVRAFFYENAQYWLEEYRFDGLRFDAIDTIYDGPNRRFMHEIADLVAANIDRRVHLTVENDRNEARLLETGFSGQWNDDAHHAAHVAITEQTDGYYSDYVNETVKQIGIALTSGFIFQGQESAYRKGVKRGHPSGHLPLTSFVTFLQNHDQIGNRPFGNRIATIATPEALRAMLGVMLLAPTIPLLFMGEEWAASTPFQFFCDFEPELAQKVTEGRRNEFSKFAEFSDPEQRERIPDPSSPETFERSKLKWEERTTEPHATWLRYYTKLLHLRREKIVPLIEGLRGDMAIYERVGHCGLRLRYALSTGDILAMDANLGTKPSDDFVHGSNAGTTIFETHGTGGHSLPPWYVRWALR